MKILSVIIPIYNAQEGLARCLNSVMIQCKDDYEVLLIDDGSKDNSLEIARSYENKYANIVRVIAQENSGVAKTRNRGIREATGKYVMFIDNDDFLDDDYFNQYLQAICKSNYDLVVGGYKRTSDCKVLYKVRATNDAFFPYVVVAPWAKIYKREYLLENNIQFLSYGIGEDVYFNLCAYDLTERIGILDNIGYNWYYNDKSVSNTSQKRISKKIDELYLLEQIYNRIGAKTIQVKYFYYRYIVWFLLFSGRKSTVAQFMKEYCRALDWLKNHNIPLKIYVGNKRLKGETKKIRSCVIIFTIMHRVNFVNCFAKIYCDM